LTLLLLFSSLESFLFAFDVPFCDFVVFSLGYFSISIPSPDPFYNY